MKTITINQQTRGPLVACDHYLHAREKKFVAVSGGDENQKEANARLLAASYNAFDKAARELGVDATELAERIDLAALILAATNAVLALKHWPETDLKSGTVREALVLETRGALLSALSPVSK